jgi:hypothetical protein
MARGMTWGALESATFVVPNSGLEPQTVACVRIRSQPSYLMELALPSAEALLRANTYQFIVVFEFPLREATRRSCPWATKQLTET